MSTIEQKVGPDWAEYLEQSPYSASYDGLCDCPTCKEARKDYWQWKAVKFQKELESLQKACAEMRELLKLHHDWSVSNAKRGELVYMASLRHDTEHALSSDCGKDYVHRSEVERIVKEINTSLHVDLRPKSEVLDLLTRLEAAQQRIEKLEAALQSIRDDDAWADMAPDAQRMLRVSTEALENKV